MPITIETLRATLGWSALLSYGILLFWGIMFMCAHDFVYRLHRRWFDLTPQVFDAMHYGGMGLFKIGIFLFFLMPWVALRFFVAASG